MDGPRRLRKQGPGKPIPVSPPEVVVLPPTDPCGFTSPPELLEIAARFNAGDYRGCVEPIEVLFFARRNTLHQGLLQYVVALLQLQLGLVATPRQLLAQALTLWEPYPDWQEGLDLAALRAHAAALRERLPVDVRRAPVEQILGEWWQPPPRFRPSE